MFIIDRIHFDFTLFTKVVLILLTLGRNTTENGSTTLTNSIIKHANLLREVRFLMSIHFSY